MGLTAQTPVRRSNARARTLSAPRAPDVALAPKERTNAGPRWCSATDPTATLRECLLALNAGR
eukprot:10466004-Alexandrium_andersonii.AAC.1